MTKRIEDMDEEELREHAEDVLRLASTQKLEERVRMMDRVNQITDPNIRLPLKYILENLG